MVAGAAAGFVCDWPARRPERQRDHDLGKDCPGAHGASFVHCRAASLSVPVRDLSASAFNSICRRGKGRETEGRKAQQTKRREGQLKAAMALLLSASSVS